MERCYPAGSCGRKKAIENYRKANAVDLKASRAQSKVEADGKASLVIAVR